jgi:hypothetical protein
MMARFIKMRDKKNENLKFCNRYLSVDSVALSLVAVDLKIKIK